MEEKAALHRTGRECVRLSSLCGPEAMGGPLHFPRISHIHMHFKHYSEIRVKISLY